MAMQGLRERGFRTVGLLVLAAAVLSTVGCYNPPVDVSQTPAPFRFNVRKGEELSGKYEDEVTGGQLFSMYCGYCHNARAIGERPFSNYQNVAAHMRVRANLTGKEYDKLMVYLRRWHDVPEPDHNEAPSPKRTFFSQPISELKDKQPATQPDLPAGPRPGTNDPTSPGQPSPGSAPREGR